MPPHGHSHSSHSSHHSSSHHSSSHHSSYHSSSSHSSSPRSSSYSRSYSSGPSSHSTSSYTSRPSTRFTRQRTNQPRGYNGSVPGYSPARRHHCVKHDYMYFPVSWVDEKTNTHYRKGYYDEMGNHYDDIAFKKNGEYTASFHCDYCDSDLKYAWKEGAAPKCPNCGAELNEMGIVTDEIVEEPVGAGNSASIAKKIVIGYFSIVFGFMFLGCIGSIASNAFGSHEYNDYEYSEDYDDYEETYGAYNPDLFGDTYYVEEIGRDCEWLDEYESYYDEDTDCYFYYNVDLEPAIWQYWYEDISSDYGDYGWMEYAEDEDSWYIEDRGGHWIELPDEYDTSYLWHIDD